MTWPIYSNWILKSKEFPLWYCGNASAAMPVVSIFMSRWCEWINNSMAMHINLWKRKKKKEVEEDINAQEWHKRQNKYLHKLFIDCIAHRGLLVGNLLLRGIIVKHIYIESSFVGKWFLLKISNLLSSLGIMSVMMQWIRKIIIFVAL